MEETITKGDNNVCPYQIGDKVYIIMAKFSFTDAEKVTRYVDEKEIEKIEIFRKPDTLILDYNVFFKNSPESVNSYEMLNYTYGTSKEAEEVIQSLKTGEN